MIDLFKVGNKITNYRKMQNLTQDDLANLLFVTRQALSKWETGTSAPSLESLVDLCKIFKTNIDDLLCLNEEKESIDVADLFRHHSRVYILNEIITGKLKVNIADILYQFSNEERFMILRAIKNKTLSCTMHELTPKLTPAEQKFLFNKIKGAIYL